jgi:hypothetical protein
VFSVSTTNPQQTGGSDGKVQGKTRERQGVYVGVDLHRMQWHVTIRTEEGEVFSGVIPGKWDCLKKLLDRYRGYKKEVVHEAGYFEFWLHDHW